MTSRVALWLNQSFESKENNSQLNSRLKQVSELGFENVVINAALALNLFQQKININFLLIKAIVYSDDNADNDVEQMVACHHEFNCDLAVLSEDCTDKMSTMKEEFMKMGLKVDTKFRAIEEAVETTHKSHFLLKSPLSQNPIPMTSKLFEEAKETKELINKFMRLKGNNLLLISCPDLKMIDFLKQAKDMLNRLYFLQTQ